LPACFSLTRLAAERELPASVVETPLKSEEIPVIRRAVAGGTVEITRGCGRGCQFCSPDPLAFRSIADSLICFTDRSRARG
jgi:radical SAM superfamily enzyme YgiQ (UPF0313 family)